MKSRAKKDKIIIGITGEIAAGKSVAASFLKEKGMRLIDADKIGHEILQRDDIKNQLVKTFGNQILSKDSTINRQALGKIVFEDLRKLEKLNSIVHPVLTDEILSRITHSPARFLVIDAALLCDWGLDRICEYTILIAADPPLRLERLVKKGMDPEDAKRRIQAHTIHCDKVDLVIKNNESYQGFIQKIEKIWKEINAEKMK
jgi:dephospho-CoA kinase